MEMEAIVVALVFVAFCIFVALLVIGICGIAGGSSDRALCAVCRYPVKGLSAPICPECGGRLEGKATKPVGSPTWQWHPPRVVSVCCLLVLTLPLMLPLIASVLFDAPRVYYRSMTAVITPKTATSTPWQVTIAGTGTFTLEARSSRLSNRHVTRPHTYASVEGAGNGSRFQLIDEHLRATFTSRDQRVTTANAFTAAAVERWLEEHKVVIVGDSREEILGEIASAIIWVATGGIDAPPNTNTIHTKLTPYQWWRPAIGVQLCLVVGLGLFCLLLAIRVSRTPPGPVLLGLSRAQKPAALAT